MNEKKMLKFSTVSELNEIINLLKELDVKEDWDDAKRIQCIGKIKMIESLIREEE